MRYCYCTKCYTIYKRDTEYITTTINDYHIFNGKVMCLCNNEILPLNKKEYELCIMLYEKRNL